MIIDVPYRYSAEVHRRRRKAPDREEFAGSVRVDVAEATRDEAPVAMWWVSSGFDKDRYRTDLSRQMAVRAHGGRLFEAMPSGPYAKVEDADALTAVARPFRTKSNTAWRPDVLSAEGLRSWTKGNVEKESFRDVGRLEDEKGTTLLGSDRDDREAKALASMSRLLVVDGVVCRDVGRPLYEPACSYRHHLTSVRADRPDMKAARFVRPEFYDDWARNAKAEKLQLDAADIKAMRPDVVDAALLDFDFAAWMADGVGRAVLASMARLGGGSWSRSPTVLAGYDKPVILALGRLRDAIRSGVSAEEVALLVGAFGEAAEPHGTLNEEAKACAALTRRMDAISPAENAVQSPGRRP